MPFSHHSHSGQFCKHAKDSLEECIQAAIAKGMKTFCLTEHMPRDIEDFYPEEIDHYPDAASLAAVSDDFYSEAIKLRQKYGKEIALPIAFESEWIRPNTLNLIRKLQAKYSFDMFVGSLHHVHTIPIDFSDAMYKDARKAAGGTDERLFEDYFDAQLEMLQALKPPVVGHFDLIRLLSDDPEGSFQSMPGVWSRAMRNLDFVAEYGGFIELNTAALRKGMKEPYPKGDICKEFLKRGGGFVLSDDSHGVDHVATNYAKIPKFLEDTDITHLHAMQQVEGASGTEDEPKFEFVRHEVKDIKAMAFWTNV